MKIQIFILGVILFSFSGFSQQTYTLEKCLDIAFTNNFDLKGMKLKAESSQVNLNQSWGTIMPSLNGNYNLGINNGRSIDPFTNGYINQQLTFSNAGLSASIPVFNGFRLKNTIKQSYLNLRASEMEFEEAKQNLTVRITLAYLQVLNMRDVLELNKARLEVTKKQVDRLAVLYNEGQGNPADYTDMKGQLANDEVSLIASKNALKQSIAELFLLMGLDSDFNASFENIEMLSDFVSYPMTDEAIYNEALQNLATFKAKALREDAAKSGVSVAKASFAPEVYVFGQLNTNYSSAAQLFNEIGISTVETGDFVTIGGQPYNVMANRPQYEYSSIGYRDQFDNNLSTSYGLGVSIPLFNGFKAKNNVKLSKIALEQSQIELQSTKLQYKQSIELAYADMEAALGKYQTLEHQVEVFEESFRINEIRFNNGVSNVIEYIISKNNLDAAKQNLSMVRYEYVLRTKVLDYYRGDF
jgi:outer membrane protein